MKRALIPLVAVLLLAGCATTRPIFPPATSVQEIRQQADGRWRVTVRLQNYALRSMRFTRLELRLSIAGHLAGLVDTTLDMDIAATGSDVAVLTLQPGVAARAALLADKAGNIAYNLDGSVRAGPKPGDQRDYPLTHQGYLSPVPGLPDAWR
ncbi:MAG: hypothetical protein ACYC97_04140 [Metallibacterium sp.]